MGTTQEGNPPMPIYLRPVVGGATLEPEIPAVPDLDRRGYPRSPVTRPEYRKGKPNPWKGRTHPAEVYTPDECWAMINACPKSRPTGRRDAALLMVYWRAGLRCAEGLSLRPKDIDLERGVLTVLCGKGGKRRVVPFDPEACAYIADWMDYRAGRGFDGSHTVFPVMNGPTKGQHLGGAYVRQMMKHVGIVAGVEKVARPHCWRHTYADYMLTKGVPIHIIQRCLGHSNVATTMRYADHLNPMAVLEALRDFEWPAAA